MLYSKALLKTAKLAKHFDQVEMEQLKENINPQTQSSLVGDDDHDLENDNSYELQIFEHCCTSQAINFLKQGLETGLALCDLKVMRECAYLLSMIYQQSIVRNQTNVDEEEQDLLLREFSAHIFVLID